MGSIEKKDSGSSLVNVRKGKKKKRVIALALCVVVLVGAIFSVRILMPQEASAAEYTEYTISRGDVVVSLSGSGAIQPNALFEVASTIGGDVVSDTFEEGDEVGKGALLYTLDSSEIENSLGRANLSLERSRNNYSDTAESFAGLNVSAPMRGRIAEIYVQTGDNVGNGGKVLKIIEDKYLSVIVPFSSADASALSTGQQVVVTVENTFETLPGTISKIHAFSRVADGYLDVTDVEISIENPGALTDGIYVTVNAGEISSYEGGALEGGSEKIVSAKTSGMVDEIHVLVGEYVEAGAQLVTLTSDSLSNNMRDSGISLQEAELSWENTSKQLENYSLTSPISGSVISKTIKAGDTLEAGAKTVMAVIADMSIMSFTINVDELDIAKVQKGQSASIVVDALSGSIFSGTVDNVGILGSTSNGVTTYPVKIVFDTSDGLWPGMNATATIVVDSVSDVLVIPVGAVSRGNLVLVKGALSDSESNDSTGNGANVNAVNDGSGTPGANSANGSENVSGGVVGGGENSAAADGVTDANGTDTIGDDWSSGRPEGAPAFGEGVTGGGETGAVGGANVPIGGSDGGANVPIGGSDGSANAPNGGDAAWSGGRPEGAPTGERMRPPTGDGTSVAVSGAGVGRPNGGRPTDAADYANVSNGGSPSDANVPTNADANVSNGGSPSDANVPTSGGSANVPTNAGANVPNGDRSAGANVPTGEGANVPNGAGEQPADAAWPPTDAPALGESGADAGAFGSANVPSGGTATGRSSGAFTSEPIDQSGAPAGTHYVRVSLGLNNDSFIEVTGGLEEGQIIMIPVAAENSLTSPQTMTMFAGPGMMGGGVGPGGGAPGGGDRVVRQYNGGGAQPSGGSGRNGGQ
jgi:HlyD family secretion protein